MLYAAVVIPIVRYDEPAIVFVRRAAHLRRNPGEIGFPGGVIDASDSDPRAAALREFEEELGVPRERVRIIDRLEDVVTLALSVTVSPYVGIVDPPVAYAPSDGETQEVYDIPLHAVYAPGALRHGVEQVVREGHEYAVPSWLFDYGPVHVWGATARMLSALVTRYPKAVELLARA